MKLPTETPECSSTPPRILVSSNCQTWGIASALQAICDVGKIHTVGMVGEPPDILKEKLATHLSDSDVFIFAANNPVACELAGDAPAEMLKLKVPVIHFKGFHPDLCYAKNRSTHQLTELPYNSTIAVWAYSKGMDVAETAGFFRPEVFHALGYFEAWNTSVQSLKIDFDSSDLGPRFKDFLMRVKRTGCFMHSINHPNIQTIIALAEIIAGELGLPIRRKVGPGELNDALNGTIWPVYPAIADFLGLDSGSYNWKWPSKAVFIDGLEPYLEATFAAYRNQGILPADIEIAFQEFEPVYKVLNNFASS